jgi:hypothetical protein
VDIRSDYHLSSISSPTIEGLSIIFPKSTQTTAFFTIARPSDFLTRCGDELPEE